jgi:hypothetical protein
MSAFMTIDCTAGSGIDNVSKDAQRIADMLGISVDFRFNDVHCVATPGGSAEYLAEEQQRQQARKLERPRDIRFASSRSRHPSVEAVS